MSKKLILIIFTIIIVTSVIAVGIYCWQKFSNEKEKNQTTENIKTESKEEIPETKGRNLPEEFSDWNLFTDPKLPFTIRYPKSWKVSGNLWNTIFTPSGITEGDDVSLQGAIVIARNAGGGRCASDYGMDFKSYLNCAGYGFKDTAPCLKKNASGHLGWDNFEYIDSMEEITTLSGLTGYKTIWASKPFLGEKLSVSPNPLAFFEYCDKSTWDTFTSYFTIYLNEMEYMDIYDKMIKTYEIL